MLRLKLIHISEKGPSKLGVCCGHGMDTPEVMEREGMKYLQGVENITTVLANDTQIKIHVGSVVT